MPANLENSATSISDLLTTPKPLTVWITINCGKFFKRWEYQITWPASWETYMQIRKPQDWKRSVFFPIPKKGNAKECSNYRTTALISHASKVTLKILQVRLQQYMNHELPDVQARFREAEEPEIKLPTSAGSWKKQESSRKTSISALLTMPKPLTVWITINCGKFWKR